MKLVSRYILPLVVTAALALPAAAQTGSASTTGAGAGDKAKTGMQSGSSTSTAGAGPSSMTTGGTPSVLRADRLFLEKAAAGGLMEVQLGQLAAQKGSSPEVKQFGQRMVDDHTKANNQLKPLAQQKGINPPDKLPAADQAKVDKLSKLSGADFDKAYMKDMVSDHKKDVAEFQKEANSSKDNDIKNFAAQTLPTLQDHLKQAEQVNASLSGKSAASDQGGGKKKSSGGSL